MPATHIKAGDPLVPTLAADARLGPTSYSDDHIWELSLGGGEPPCLAIQTTFGLRARSFRIFPRFIIQDVILSDPATFTSPIIVKYLSPNFLRLACVPHPGINVEIEYWVPSSQTLAGRTLVTNTRSEPVILDVEWVSLLTPDASGQRMALLEMGLYHLLAGKTGNLTPVLYLCGIVRPGQGPYTALSSHLELAPQETQAVTWFEAAQSTPELSFALAHQLGSRQWDAEIARIELLNTRQLDIRTGIPDWDVAFTLAQNTARSLILSGMGACPHPSTVSSRLPDQGYSMRGDGSDYSHLWDGQTLLDLYYLMGFLLPGEASFVRGFLENVIASQLPDGDIPRKPYQAGQPGQLSATPLLAVLVWRYYQFTDDLAFLHTVFPSLLSFVQSWFSSQHDRDGDGIPEWDHLLQTGIDDHPLFAHWHPWSQGMDISMVEGPDLCAYLYAEIDALIQISTHIGQSETTPFLRSLATHLHAAVEASWEESSHSYHYWDRESHFSTSFQTLGVHQGPGRIPLTGTFLQPVRLLVRVQSSDDTTRPAMGFIHGTGPSGGHRVERISPERFRWHLGTGCYTSDRIYTSLEHIDIQGILDTDQVTIQTPYLRCREQSVLLPLWAGIPKPERARRLIKTTIMNSRLFWGAYGLRACAEKPASPAAASHYLLVHPMINSLIGEGLLHYDQRHGAAELFTHLMNAIIPNLKQNHAFYHSYLASDGHGQGERNSISGLPPLGLFLQTLGVQIITPFRIKITGPNPFPWTVTIKYKGLTVIQQKKKAMIIFPDGQNITVHNDKPQLVSQI